MANYEKGRAVLVLTTAGSAAEASRLAGSLVEERLAACVNVVGPVRSVFRWKGKKEKQREWLLLIKTGRRALRKLTAHIKSAHSYDLPEVIALPVVGGLGEYLDWVLSETAIGGTRGQSGPRRRSRAGKKRMGKNG